MSNRICARLGASAVLSLSFATAASAQGGGVTQLPDLTIVTSPLVQSSNVDSYSGSSETVGAAQIRDQNSVDLPSALRETPGVEMSRFDPVGSYAGDQGGRVFIHGLGSGAPGAEIQTYIDGVPVYSPVWGHPLLDTLPVSGISAINVNLGPRPWINGDNWGSINLVTARPTEDGIHGDIQASGGMLATGIEKANIYGKFGAADFTLSESGATSNGARPNAEGRIGDLMGRFGYQIDPHWRADLSFLYVDSVAYDPQPNYYPPVPIAPHYDTQLGMVSGSVSHEYDNLKGELKVYYTGAVSNWINTTYALAPTLANVYNAQYTFHTQGVHAKESASPWSGGWIDFGLDHDEIAGHNTTQAPFPTPVDIGSPTFALTSVNLGFHQDFHLGGGWTLTPSAGVRAYDHNIFPATAAPYAGLQLSSDRLTVYASYARGVHYPGLEVYEFSQLYPFFGNSWRSLTAEIDDHVETGVKAKPWQGGQVDANVFADFVSNRYDFDFATGTDLNYGAYRSQGFQISLRQEIAPNWQAFVGWTELSTSASLLPFVPHDTVALGLNGSWDKFNLAIDAQYRSSIWGLTDFRGTGIPVTELRVDPFFVANARLSYAIPQLGKKGQVFVEVENILNRNYSYTPGYPQPGTTAQVGVIASF